jgi:ZipA, C-terminal FtsZ-binding domain
MLFNRWQERKLRQQMEVFEPDHKDILLREDMAQPGRVEPELREFPLTPKIEQELASEPAMAPLTTGSPPATSPEAEAVVAEVATSESEGGASQLVAEAEALATAKIPKPSGEPAKLEQLHGKPAVPVKKIQLVPSQPPADLVDGEIEFIVRIGFDKPILASELAEAMQALTDLGKPVRWAGLPAPGQPDAGAVETEWEEASPFRHYAYCDLAVGLQLADRNGALPEDTLELFCNRLRDFAGRHSGRVACPDVKQAVKAGNELDLFCVDVDVLIGLNVVAQGTASFSGRDVAQLAQAAGMQLSEEGIFHCRDEGGESLFSLCNQASMPFSQASLDDLTTHGVTLLFDVPRVGDGLTVFDRMAALGRKLASELGGLLVDDNSRPLTDAGIAKIREQLGQIYAAMDARGVPAGGTRARRLFA